MASADAVVIGGGANGTSTAFQLASLGMRRVILVERRALASGATGKSGSLVRMHYTNEAESRLAHESLKVFRTFRDVTGFDCGFEPIGFVQIVGRGYEQALAHNVDAQERLGIKTTVISTDDLKRLMPGIRVDDVGAAAWEPDSGFADPNATTFAFAAAARQLGVTIRTECEATSIVTAGHTVVAVETSEGRIDTPVVVLVPGAWGNRLLAPLGLDFGLQPHRVQISVFRWPEEVRARPHMVIIDSIHHSWMRPEGWASSLIGVELGVTHGDPDHFHEGVDPEYVKLCRDRLAARFPAFAGATMRGGWAGMIMMSPDGRPIIDHVPSVHGLFVMLGDSGTSFKTSPAIGKCLAEWIVHGQPRTCDLFPFRSTRFAEGKPWVDEHHYGSRGTISR